MSALRGRKIALLESRRRREIAALVEELGGVPVSAPAVDEVICHDDFDAFFNGLTERRFSLAVLLSGSATATLLEEAARRGRLSDVVGAFRELKIACRGTKPPAALKRYNLKPRITTAGPHTTTELMDALASIDVAGCGVVLVCGGDRNRVIAKALLAREARLTEVCPYESMLPTDSEPIENVVRDLLADRLDAVLFTNQVQCRHLFQVAADMSQAERLVRSLNRQVVVGAVGPVCANALVRAGVTPDVVPLSASMSSLVSAVADYFESNADAYGI